MQPSSRPASTSTRPAHSPLPRQHQVNTQTKVLDTAQGRLLCIADIRGRLSALNDLARDANAKAIIHTGDFGFFESNSLERINDRTLRHLTMYSPLIPSAQRTHLLAPDNPPAVIRSTVNISLLSEFPLLLSGQIKLQVPVYTVWGACEDVIILEKFRSGTYAIDNLHVLDEATTRCIDVGGVKLRLLGLGGAFVPHKMFDNGDGNATIAGGQGTMWTTALQIGELVDTAQRVYDPTETRLFVTHTSPGREGVMAQLALVLKADLTISAGLHFRYATSYNEFSIQGDFEGFRRKLELGKEGFDKVWESVKNQVDAVLDDNQKVLLDKALSVVGRLPPGLPSTGPGATATGEEPAWKNCWNWNLCDAAYGTLVLDIQEGRISAELKSQGFNYAYRRTATVAPTPNAQHSALPTPQSNPVDSSLPPTKRATPVPDRALPPHLAQSNPTSPLAGTGKESPATGKDSPATGKDSPTTGKDSPVTGTVKLNGLGSAEKAEREKAKKKEKKERKERERVEKTEREKAETPKPDVASAVPASVSAADGAGKTEGGRESPRDRDEIRSPITDSGSTGLRTPKTPRPPRHPWTIFMRMTVSVTDSELREFFGEASSGITRINWPTVYANRPRLAYVEFGDEDAMKAGLEKHQEKLKDTIPEVKQATDQGSRGDNPHRGGPGGRGRGRGGGGSYAARGFAAAGLTRGHGSRGGGGEGGETRTAGGGDP